MAKTLAGLHPQGRRNSAENPPAVQRWRGCRPPSGLTGLPGGLGAVVLFSPPSGLESRAKKSTEEVVPHIGGTLPETMCSPPRIPPAKAQDSESAACVCSDSAHHTQTRVHARGTSTEVLRGNASGDDDNGTAGII